MVFKLSLSSQLSGSKFWNNIKHKLYFWVLIAVSRKTIRVTILRRGFKWRRHNRRVLRNPIVYSGQNKLIGNILFIYDNDSIRKIVTKLNATFESRVGLIETKKLKVATMSGIIYKTNRESHKTGKEVCDPTTFQ